MALAERSCTPLLGGATEWLNSFERDVDPVRRATNQYSIDYPVPSTTAPLHTHFPIDGR